MKFKVTESCIHSEGQHAEAGTVIDVLPSEAAKLQQAGRGYPAPAEPTEQAVGRAELAGMMDSMLEQTKDAVAEGVKRGGKFKK